MKYLLLFLPLILLSCAPSSQQSQNTPPIDPMDFAVYRITQSLPLAPPEADGFPRTLEKNRLKTVTSSSWVSGFYPGTLWLAYENNKDPKLLAAAKNWTNLLAGEQFNNGTHDTGFMMNSSYGQGYRLTQNPEYKKVLIQTAKTLCSRYDPMIGCIKSWDWSKEWQFPVIIDNMMNLELLFLATRLSGDSTFYKVAVDHANTTLANHFRLDGSSYHVVDYDSLTGKVLQKVTHQGAFDESAWTRGQAWGLYGFTVCFRETGDSMYLNKASEIAAYMLFHKNLPPDKIPYWDFDTAEIPNTERDASAAAVMASALLELDDYVPEIDFRKVGIDIVETLSSPAYRAEADANHPFLLLHSVGSKPSNSEVNVPLVYADYYYVEALGRVGKLSSPITP